MWYIPQRRTIQAHANCLWAINVIGTDKFDVHKGPSKAGLYFPMFIFIIIYVVCAIIYEHQWKFVRQIYAMGAT